MGVRALCFFLLSFLPKKNGQKSIPHKKKHLFCFFLIQKNEKKKRKKKKCPPSSSSSPLLLRPTPTACTSATSRGRPPSRSYKRCSRTRRASRSQPCVSSWSSFVVALLVFFLFRVVSLFWRTQSALCRKERRHDGDQNRDCADSFDDKKNDDEMGFAHPIVSPKEARDATSPDHPLSLSRRETTT